MCPLMRIKLSENSPPAVSSPASVANRRVTNTSCFSSLESHTLGVETATMDNRYLAQFAAPITQADSL